MYLRIGSSSGGFINITIAACRTRIAGSGIHGQRREPETPLRNRHAISYQPVPAVHGVPHGLEGVVQPLGVLLVRAEVSGETAVVIADDVGVGK